MIDISAKDLFGRLNENCYHTLDSAVSFCRLRGNPKVEFVHWIHQLCGDQKGDFQEIFRHFHIDETKLAEDVTAALSRLPRGATSLTGFGMSLREAVEQGWVYASLMYKQGSVRAGHVLVGCFHNPSLETALYGISQEFRKISGEKITEDLLDIVSASSESTNNTAVGGAVTSEDGITTGEPGADSALARFTVDLTEQAKAEEIDPIFGRDTEIRQLIDILLRRRQNNPILTGEAGVGKTAVVEGFAMKIVQGDVPPPLKNVSVKTLDLGLLKAGASVRGEFEQRLRNVIEEIEGSPTPIILFIDEAHTLVGAGGQEGNDAANLLKPALARGKLRTIAATTWKEYKLYIEKDNALERRFQPVVVEEPDEDLAVSMLRGVARKLSEHHETIIHSAAVPAAVKLALRYIPARQLPDKAVSLLDTACARVALSQYSTPAQVEQCEYEIQTLDIEKEVLESEEKLGTDHTSKLQEIDQKLDAANEKLANLQEHWEKEKALVDECESLREQLLSCEDESLGEGLKLKLKEEGDKLLEMQGEDPLVHPEVTPNTVASIVADWTGVPVGKMVKDEIKTILRLAEILKQRVIGQDHALEAIAKRIEISRAELENPNKPLGVFMLAGTSGVGKTETAVALAEALYGGEDNLISLNMTEFTEGHSVATLKGAPPGYKGFGEGGVLTEAVRKRPYSVILLDEIEKAHPNVIQLFFQVFDKGRLDDSTGRSINFRNTIIIMTTNAGTELITNLCEDPDLMPSAEKLTEAVRQPILEFKDGAAGQPKFTPAFLGRVNLLAYYPLSDEILSLIIELQLSRLQKRVLENRNVEFTYSDDVPKAIADRCNEVQSGARVVEGILTQTLIPELSRELLTSMSEDKEITKAYVSINDDGFVYDLT